MATWAAKVNARVPGTEVVVANQQYKIGEVDSGRIYLKDAPLESAALTVTNLAATVTYTRVTTAPAVGQYFAYFSGALAGLLVFNPADDTKDVLVSLTSRGTPIWANDINRLQTLKRDTDVAIPWADLSGVPALALVGSQNSFTDIQWGQAAGTVWAFAARVTGDANPRIALRTDGALVMGPGGATAPDTVLSRSAAGIVSTATLNATTALTSGGYIGLATYLSLANASQPTAPAAGVARMWWDNTAGALKTVNSSGIVTTLGQPVTTESLVRSIMAIGNLETWFEPEEGLTAPGASLGFWDRSGKDRNSSGGAAVMVAGSRALGQRGYYFDDSTHGVSWGYAPATPVTIIVVYAPNSTVSTAQRLVDGANNFLIGPYNGFNQIHNAGFIAGSALAAGVFTTIMATIDGTGTKGYEKNALIGSNGTVAGPGALNFGKLGGSAAPANSTMLAMFVFSKVLSAAESNTVHEYIKHRFGISYTPR